MKRFCPYCQGELDYLNAVKEEAITWNGDNWTDDPQAIIEFQCPECGSGLDSTDLDMLGISIETLKKVT